MPDPTTTSKAPRIAIKFGKPSTSRSQSSNGTHKNGPLQPSSSLGKRPRAHILDDDESEEDEIVGKAEAVTSFGANGAENDKERKSIRRDKKVARNDAAPFVIPCEANRDWKAVAQGQREGRSVDQHEDSRKNTPAKEEEESVDRNEEIKWGLNLSKPGQDLTPLPADTARDEEATPSGENKEEEQGEAQEIRNPDREAIDALLGKKKATKQHLVITEDDALQRDYETVGEVSTLEEYGEIPEGEFGAALLRGMGWDGKTGVKVQEVKRRPNLMGLGAKEDEELRKAEAAKKRGYRERRPRLDEYRKEKERERQQREDRHPSSYKNERDKERERDRGSHGHSRRYEDRDRDPYRERNRDRDDHRHRERSSRR
jgi:hypothetical protein